MSVLRDHLEQSIRRRRLFRRGQPILVAVSGGVDSMVLLHALHALSAQYGWRLAVAHLNHQLRGRSSEADERLVRHTAKKLNLKLVVGRANVRGLARARKLSLEMAARKARHDFLARAAGRLRIRAVALAHHADDQLETFFLRLLRGAGGEGLGGMKWRNPSPTDPRAELVRPLLDLPKSALRQHAAEESIRFHEDASNKSPEIQRNRIRHELLPLLEQNFQPALARTILRAMEILGAEAEFVTEAAQEWLGRARSAKYRTPKRARDTEKDFQPSILDRRPLNPFDNLAVAVQRRSLQLQLLELGISPDFELVEQLRTIPGRPVSVGQPAFGGSGAGDRPAPLEKTGQGPFPRSVVRDASGFVQLHRAADAGFTPASFELELEGRAGEVVFDGARILWRVAKADWQSALQREAGREIFDADKVGSRVLLRHWRPGDRFQPIGMAAPVKLQDIFTNQKVPRARRHELMVAASPAGEIFWVEGLRISERFKLTKMTICALHWRWQRL